MSQALYRRKAILTRIRKALDAFYLLQKIDWEYDGRSTLEKILGLALAEVEFEEGKQIERGLIIVREPAGESLEIQAGWKSEDIELTFSRTVVQQTIASGEAILCENAKDDPRFMEAESIKNLETLSLISVPLRFETETIGALYIESKSPRNLFNEADLDFLREFTDIISPYIKTALTHQGHLRALLKLQERVTGRYRFSNIIGRSSAMVSVFDLVRIATEVDRTVLITGESGCGKELIAHAIHYNGPRRSRAFVVVDCSSLAEHLLESELFGHRKGAFTGASADKVGAFEEAEGGTIFLDEISDASKPLQQKLRRVLAEGEIRRVGDNAVRRVDVRVICATNNSLSSLVESGEFMRDLYFRINKFPIHIPPLRERREDIPILIEHFLTLSAEDSKGGRRILHPEALEILVRRDWAENNVRELRNTLELAIDFCGDGEITPAIVQRVLRLQRGEPERRPEAARLPLPTAAGPGTTQLVSLDPERFAEVLRKTAERPAITKDETPYYRIQLEASAQAIIGTLRRTKWKLRPAAKLLGISPTKLRCDLKEYLEEAIGGRGGDLLAAAEAVQIPLKVLRKKARDLGLGQMVRDEET